MNCCRHHPNRGAASPQTDMRLSSGLTLLLLILLAGLALLALPASKASLLEGSVHGEDGPLAGARVRYRGEAIRTVTDAAGRFHLPRRSPSRRVTAWNQGYFIGGARPTSSLLAIRLVPLPVEDNADYEWVDPDPSAAHVHNLRQLPRRDLPRMVGKWPCALGDRPALPQSLRGQRLAR